jgi:hypothetical protein
VEPGGGTSMVVGGRGKPTSEPWRRLLWATRLGEWANTFVVVDKTTSAVAGQRRPLAQRPWRVAAWHVAARRGRGREFECLRREVAQRESTTVVVTRWSTTPFPSLSECARLGRPQQRWPTRVNAIRGGKRREEGKTGGGGGFPSRTRG